VEKRQDVEHALKQMPAPLREICSRLMYESMSEVARALGISRHQVRKAVEAARPYFEETGPKNSKSPTVRFQTAYVTR